MGSEAGWGLSVSHSPRGDHELCGLYEGINEGPDEGQEWTLWLHLLGTLMVQLRPSSISLDYLFFSFSYADFNFVELLTQLNVDLFWTDLPFRGDNLFAFWRLFLSTFVTWINRNFSWNWRLKICLAKWAFFSVESLQCYPHTRHDNFSFRRKLTLIMIYIIIYI